MFKALLTWPVLLVLVTILPAVGQKSSPASQQAAEIETLVNKAAEILESQGRKAFEEFRKKDSPWRYGDVYLFVVDMQGIVLFNAARPNREGRDLLNDRDADGKQFNREFLKVVRKFGSGWVDYMFPKPGQSTPTVKWSYVRGTRVDGVEALVGAGVYVD
jgi:signal transduction histidine kinase